MQVCRCAGGQVRGEIGCWEIGGAWGGTECWGLRSVGQVALPCHPWMPHRQRQLHHTVKLSQAIAGGRPTNLGNALAQSHAGCFRKIFHEDHDFSTEVRAEQDDACHGAATVLTLLSRPTAPC